MNPKFEQIDRHARSAPARVTGSVDKLTAYLSQSASNDLEKVRSFYVWIAEHIAYDVQTFRHYRPGRYQTVTPDEVLRQRKAVCQGYSELFQAMCQRANIPCYVVPGYSKGINRANRDFRRGDHAWNVVKIDGQWYPLDATWGSGGLNDQLKFVRAFNEAYFLTDPKVFVLDHLPLDPMWQLMDCPVNLAAFAAGEEAIRRKLAGSTQGCEAFAASINKYEELSAEEQGMLSAQRAYRFNSENPLMLVHAYMNQAHRLMSGIPTQLRDRAAMEAALAVQEEAVGYLEKARKVLNRTDKGEAKQEKKLLEANLKNSRNNLKGLREVLGQ